MFVHGSCFGKISILWCFKILNSLFFLFSQSQEEVCDLIQAAPFQKNIPMLMNSRHPEKSEARMKALEARYANLHVANNIEKFGNPRVSSFRKFLFFGGIKFILFLSQQVVTARDADLLTRERLCCGLSLFETFLKRIREFLEADRAVWMGAEKPKNSIMHIDECVEFARVWSALQFVYCLPVSKMELTVEELFGEGLNWAGCTLIILLGQMRRFEVLDFSYQLLKVQRFDGCMDMIDGVSIKQMVDRIRRFQVLNSQIFSILNKYLTSGAVDDNAVEQVTCLNAPTYPKQSKSLVILIHESWFDPSSFHSQSQRCSTNLHACRHSLATATNDATQRIALASDRPSMYIKLDLVMIVSLLFVLHSHLFKKYKFVDDFTSKFIFCQHPMRFFSVLWIWLAFELYCNPFTALPCPKRRTLLLIKIIVETSFGYHCSIRGNGSF